MPTTDPIKLKEKWRRYRQTHKTEIAAYRKTCRALPAWRAKAVAYALEWQRRNPEWARLKDARKRATLRDRYVRELLRAQMPGLKGTPIPRALIEAKRAQLMIHRLTTRNGT